MCVLVVFPISYFTHFDGAAQISYYINGLHWCGPQRTAPLGRIRCDLPEPLSIANTLGPVMSLYICGPQDKNP